MAIPSSDITSPLNVLILEDDPDDAALLSIELRKAGYRGRVHIVDTREDFSRMLTPEIDLILSDHALPQFNAHEALRLLQEKGLDIPFIIVSGAISEEAAVEAMRRGAADYVLKDRPARLSEAIRSALRAREERREKERAFETIRESEALSRSVLNSLSAHIAVIARDGRMLAVNDTWEAFEAEAGDTSLARARIGANYLDVLQQEVERGDTFAQQALSGLEGVLAGRHTQFSMEYRVDGREKTYWFEMRVTPLVGSRQGGAVIAYTDITSRKYYEQQLIETKEAAEEMARLKSAFLSNMSHEIRTPLTAVLGFAEILKDELGHEHQELVSLILEGGQRLKNTLTSVLELSQLQGERVELSRKPVDVVSLVDTVGSLLMTQTREKGLTLDTSGVMRPLLIYSDWVALERVLSNLVGNAIKFSERGTIRVAARQNGASVEISVSDTGIGIDDTYLPNLFEEFRQESSGIGRSYEGVGLGLAITKRLLDLMGGTISVESRKGEGSTFTVTVPVGAPPASETGGGRAAAVPGEADRRRVLVVEDNQITRMLLGRLLGPLHSVTLAATPEEALAAEGPFDVVLVDINLGTELSGVDLLPLLRRQESGREAHFMALTAYALPGDRERLLAAGFDSYIAKPFSPVDLLNTIAAGA